MSLHNSTRETRMDFSTRLNVAREQPCKLLLIQIKSPAQAGFDLRGEADKQGSESGVIHGKLLGVLRRRSS